MFILASSSPRRRELIKKIVDDFIVVVPDIDEKAISCDIENLPALESKAKAYAVFSEHPDDDILSCDTVVICEGELLGKPLDEEDAKRMLRKEAGKKQIVLSGYTFISKNVEITRTVRSEVYFNKLSDEQIERYISEMKPLDKAGAYGIQDGYGLIEKIVGSYDNVMGLPTEDIKKHCPLKRKSD